MPSCTMATSTKPVTAVHVRRPSAQRVSLASRAHVDMGEKGLTSVAGGKEVIAAIRARKSVTKVILSYNNLGDYGCQELFRFLCTEGRHYRITEMFLKANDIGDIGLDAIAAYLDRNDHLTSLELQSNKIQGDALLGVKLANAINSSRLETLSLNTNPVTDEFFTSFLMHLNAPHFKDLQLGSVGITRESGPTLINYLSSPRCHALETFKCNGTRLGLQTVNKLAQSLKKFNFTVQKLELFAYHPLEDDSEGGEQSAEEVRAKWEAIVQICKQVLVRNDLLKKRAHSDALNLLAYSRPLLMTTSKRNRSKVQTTVTAPRTLSEPAFTSEESALATPSTSIPKSVTSFRALPIEIQQHILSLLAPSLSSSQRINVFDYASTPSTLKPLLQLPGAKSAHAGCIPDPATLPFSGASLSLDPSSLPITTAPTSTPKLMADLNPSANHLAGNEIHAFRLDQIPKMNRKSCAGGRCMGAGGSVFCHRYETRLAWLKEVGCTQFDPAKRTEDDVLRLLSSPTKSDTIA